MSIGVERKQDMSLGWRGGYKPHAHWAPKNILNALLLLLALAPSVSTQIWIDGRMIDFDGRLALL